MRLLTAGLLLANISVTVVFLPQSAATFGAAPRPAAPSQTPDAFTEQAFQTVRNVVRDYHSQVASHGGDVYCATGWSAEAARWTAGSQQPHIQSQFWRRCAGSSNPDGESSPVWSRHRVGRRVRSVM